MTDETKGLDLKPISEEITSLAQQVIDETDVEKTKDLVSLFNWNMSKKNVARLLKLNNLYDAVSDQMVERFSKKPDQFSNDDLLNYMKVIQGAIDTSTKVLSETEEPPRIVNNTQINVNVVDTMDRASRERVADAVQAILKRMSQPQTDIIVDATEDTDN